MSCTTPVLLCTTKYYSNTTPYYKYYSVLLQYYPVLQSTTQVLLCTTPVLPCTTKYYSSTNLYTTKYYSNTTPYHKYYSVLLQYYPVLQSTTQVLLCTTPVLPCATKYYSSTTPYYKVLHDWSASHMKRHLQCAEQQKAASNFSKYFACHAKWISWLIRIAYETSFTMRGATGITLQLQQILRLPRKMNLMIDPHHIWNVIYNARSNCACHAKWMSWLIRIAYETSFTLRGATSINLQPHQILRLPRKMNLMIDPHHIWNVIYNARSNRHHPPTSPNTAPATQNESHDSSASHMKRHLQCAEQQASPSNLTKYCACHAKWTQSIRDWKKSIFLLIFG